MPQVAKTLIAANGQTVGFLEYIPAKVDGLIIMLHGQGERRPDTKDINVVATNGLPNVIAAGKFNYNYIVLCPQLNSAYSTWQNWYVDEMLIYARDILKFSGNIKCLTGLSLGGGGTWKYATTGQYREQFTSYAPICATNEYVDTAAALCAIKRFWAFHCVDDPTVTVNHTKHAEGLVYGCKSPDKVFTYYQSGGHAGAWNNAYDPGRPMQILEGGKPIMFNPNLYDWFGQAAVGTGIPITPLPNTTTAMKAEFSVYQSGTTVTLDPSQSEGIPTSFNWDFRDKGNNYVKPEIISGVLLGNNVAPSKLIVKIPASAAEVILYMKMAGTTYEKRRPVNVPTGTLPTEPPVVNKTTIAILFDGTNTITVQKDSAENYTVIKAKSI